MIGVKPGQRTARRSECSIDILDLKFLKKISLSPTGALTICGFIILIPMLGTNFPPNDSAQSEQGVSLPGPQNLQQSDFKEQQTRIAESQVEIARRQQRIEFGQLVVGGFTAALTLAAITIAIWQSRIAQASADAAAEATRISREALTLQTRPWMKMSPAISVPLTFNEDFIVRRAASVTIANTLENVGQSAAQDVWLWETLVPADREFSGDSALAVRDKWCNEHRHQTPHPGEAELSGSLFPNDPHIRNHRIVIPMDEVIKGRRLGNYDIAAYFLVGCVGYRSSSEPATAPVHQTRFLYSLVKRGSGGSMLMVVRGIAKDYEIAATDWIKTQLAD